MVAPTLAGLSPAPQVVALGLAGTALITVSLLATLARRRRSSAAPAVPARVRMHVPPVDAGEGRVTLSGIARRSSIEIPSAVSGTTCLVFGVHGAIGAADVADVADADGADFDVELASGERVMLSLEHAVLDAPASSPVPLVSVRPTLADLLERRCIPHSGEGASLTEHLVRDGDAVTVWGTPLGNAVTAGASGRGKGPSVLGGDERQPLVVAMRAHARQC